SECCGGSVPHPPFPTRRSSDLFVDGGDADAVASAPRGIAFEVEIEARSVHQSSGGGGEALPDLGMRAQVSVLFARGVGRQSFAADRKSTHLHSSPRTISHAGLC